MTGKRSDYSREVGGAAIGARLRRLSERLDRETGQIYAAQHVHFEQRWFGILNQLVLNGSMTVGEIAAVLRVTHVSVSQARQALAAAGLIEAVSDKCDARRRQLRLTDDGQVFVTKVAPLWQALSDCAAELNDEAGDLVRPLDRLEDLLDKRSLVDRVRDRLGLTPEVRS